MRILVIVVVSVASLCHFMSSGEAAFVAIEAFSNAIIGAISSHGSILLALSVCEAMGAFGKPKITQNFFYIKMSGELFCGVLLDQNLLITYKVLIHRMMRFYCGYGYK